MKTGVSGNVIYVSFIRLVSARYPFCSKQKLQTLTLENFSLHLMTNKNLQNTLKANFNFKPQTRQF